MGCAFLVVLAVVGCGIFVFSRDFSGVGLCRLIVRVGESSDVSVFVSLVRSWMMLALYESFYVHLSVSNGYSELII